MQPVLNAIRRVPRAFILSLVLVSESLVPGASVASSDAEDRDWHEIRGTTMGTTYRVKILMSPGSPVSELQESIETRLDAINNSMSTYRADSELSRFNRAITTEWIPITAALYEVVDAAIMVSKESGGAFDITVGPFVDLWGFGPAAPILRPPNAAAIVATRQRIGYRQLELRSKPYALRKRRPDLSLDLSAIAKGYAVDEIARLLRGRNIDRALIEIAGEVGASGVNANGQPWRIGLKDPRGKDEVLRIVALTDESVSTSGDYRIFFDLGKHRYSHVIDPRTGWPVAHALTQVSVVHELTMLADAYATALMVLGPEKGLALAERLGLSAVFCVRREGALEVVATSTFTARQGPRVTRD